MKNTILSLLRAGALNEAEKEYIRLGLDRVTDDEDTIALGGRILKSRALEQTGAAQRDLALKSAEKYYQAYRATDGTYSGINTAAMFALAGDMVAARNIAQTILDKTGNYSPKPGEDAYYHMATVAEAHLILGDLVMAKAALRDAIDLDPGNYDARATTVRQFEMLSLAIGGSVTEEQPNNTFGNVSGNKPNNISDGKKVTEGFSLEWLDAYRPPKAIHFAGHMFHDRAGNVGERRDIEEAVDVFIADHKVGCAFGCLAAGSDIIIAEKILAYGAELHVVLPCPETYFVETSILPFGDEWLDRFYACLAAAKSVRYTSYDTELPDDLGLSFASEVAMGLAVLKSERLATSVVQLLIWDGKPARGLAGTARDAAIWHKTNRDQVIIPFPLERPVHQKAVASEGGADTRARTMQAMLFTDVRGFSGLMDSEIPAFMQHVLKPLADACKKEEQGINFLNTWGDGLFITFNSVVEAAKVALELQKVFQAIDFERAGLPDRLAIRIGGHYGPVHELEDPFSGQRGVLGAQVTIAAKIEPVTAPGSVYVSEPFACVLAVQASGDYIAEQMQHTVRLHKSAQAVALFNLRAKGVRGS